MHEKTPIWTGGRVIYWCSSCAGIECTAVPVTTLPRQGKWTRARERQLSAGVVGDFVVQFSDGSYVARRGRKFYDRRRRGPAGELTGVGATMDPQYLRDRRMYSVNSGRASTLGQAKRWKTRQAAHKANSKLGGKVVHLPAES